MKQLIKRLIPKNLWAKARLAKLNYLVSHFSVREAAHDYGGYPLKVHLADPLGVGWYDHDWPELAEIQFLKQHQLRAGATVFDLGAHQGVVALMLLKTVEPGGKVIALEANGHNAAVAEKNKELNAANQLVILNAAAAEESGTLWFNKGLNGQVDDGSGEWGREEVAAYCVDALTQEYGPPQVLFIDVEGYECQVLRGAKETLKSFPDCFVEVHVGVGLEKSGGSAEMVAAFFSPEHYDVYIGSDTKDFLPMTADAALPTARFFLAAVAKHPSSQNASL